MTQEYQYLSSMYLKTFMILKIKDITIEDLEKICNLFDEFYTNLLVDDFFTKLSGMGGV